MSGVKIDVRSNIDQVTATIRALPDRLKERAIMRSINRAVDSVATESSRIIRQTYNLKHAAILKALTKHKASKITLTGDVTFKGRRVPLIEFEARWRQGQAIGATAKIFVGGRRTTYKGAFIAASTSNNARGGGSAGMNQVYVRVGRGRYPIRTLRGISIPLTLRNKVVIEAVRKVASDTFTKSFSQQIKYLTTDQPIGFAYG